MIESGMLPLGTKKWEYFTLLQWGGLARNCFRGQKKPLPWHFAFLDSLWWYVVSCSFSYPWCFWSISFRSCLFFLKTFFGGNKKLWLIFFENIIVKSSSPIYLLSFNISWETSSTTAKKNIMYLQNTKTISKNIILSKSKYGLKTRY